MSSQYLQSVENALRIIEFFDMVSDELGVTEISNLLGVGKSTAHRLLATLESRHFVEQNAKTGKYRLGLKLVHIGSNKLNSINIVAECHSVLLELSATTGESSHLSFYNQGKITFIDKVAGKNYARMSSAIGAQLPAYATGAGKMFLSGLSEDQLSKFFFHTSFKQITPATITEQENLLEQLNIIRACGYSEDQQESEEGLVCFAAPIYGHAGNIIACVSISGSASRMNSNRAILLPQVIAAAAECSRRCGWSGTETAKNIVR